jgi:uncharacterized peroxidase-related enzyme
MTRVTPLAPDQVGPTLRDAMAIQQKLLGLVPESLLTMAYRPRMASLFAELASEVLEPASLDRGLKQLVGYVSSAAAGCRYCQAHTAQSADMVGVPLGKLEEAFNFESSPLFNDAERAALRLALHGSIVPNQATDADFDELRKHFTNEQIVEIMGVIALFGWLNRWNDTMDTTLEESPASFHLQHNLRVR